MDYTEFTHLSKSFKTVPVYRRVLADLLTPISAYMKLAKGADYAFILESVEKGEKYGRYSFIGRNPDLIISSEEKNTKVYKDGKWNRKSMNFLDYI